MHSNISNERNSSVNNDLDEYPHIDNSVYNQNNGQILTHNLNENVKEEFDFPNLNQSKWQDAFLNRSLKYQKFISKRALFFSKLHITPGIGFGYAKKLENIIPNFGSLIQLYLTVDEKNFKALLFKYATINSKSLSLIYLSCQKYYEKYGNRFFDFTF